MFIWYFLLIHRNDNEIFAEQSQEDTTNIAKESIENKGKLDLIMKLVINHILSFEFNLQFIKLI